MASSSQPIFFPNSSAFCSFPDSIYPFSSRYLANRGASLCPNFSRYSTSSPTTSLTGAPPMSSLAKSPTTSAFSGL